jgi:hypothetical protein
MVIAVILGIAACGDSRSGREQPTEQAKPSRNERTETTAAGQTRLGAWPAVADPCGLVTKAEVEGLAKQPVIQETRKGTCLHRGGQPGSKVAASMTVAALQATSPQALDVVARTVAGLVPGAAGEPIRGVGDDARIVRSELVTFLFVKSGDRYLTVSVAGFDDPLAAAKTLATHALQRL